MTDEPADVRRQRGHTLVELEREDLDLWGVEELNERIAILQAEIDRARQMLARKQSTRAAADALFARKD